jgi:hypothetical protein
LGEVSKNGKIKDTQEQCRNLFSTEKEELRRCKAAWGGKQNGKIKCKSSVKISFQREDGERREGKKLGRSREKLDHPMGGERRSRETRPPRRARGRRESVVGFGCEV